MTDAVACAHAGDLLDAACREMFCSLVFAADLLVVFERHLDAVALDRAEAHADHYLIESVQLVEVFARAAGGGEGDGAGSGCGV